MSNSAVEVAPRPRSNPSLITRIKDYGRPPRLFGLDVARGLAVLGMMAAHMMMLPDLEFLHPSTWGGLVHGRSSLLFALLAGVSVAIVTGRSSIPEPAQVPRLRLQLVGRGVMIFAIGLFLEWLNTSILVILTMYGLLFVLATFFIRWSVRKLLIGAAIFALAGPVVFQLLAVLTLAPSGAGLQLIVFNTYSISAWLGLLLAGMALGRMDLSSLKVASRMLVVGAVLMSIGYGAAAWMTPHLEGGDSGWEDSKGSEGSSAWWPDTVPGSQLDPDLMSNLVCDVYPKDSTVNCYPPYDDLSSVGASSSYPSFSGSGTSSSSWSGDNTNDGIDWADYWSQLRQAEVSSTIKYAFFSASPHSGGSLEIVGSGGFALVVLALCLSLARPLRYLLLPVAALGSMPLTAYTAHVVSFMVLAGGPGGYASHPNSWYWWAALVMALGATAWSLYFKRGPLERLNARASAAMAETPIVRPSL